jgi:ATP-dependent Zn protease
MNSNMLSNKISKAGGGTVDVGKRKYEMVKNVSTRFKDVAGLEQSKL